MTADRPFRDKVRELNRTMRFIDMQNRCNDARSTAWWNNVANGRRVSPPPPETLKDIGELFGVPRQRVAEMIAEEWYSVRREADVPERARSLAAGLDLLSDDDFVTVEQLVHRLAKR